MRFLASLPEPGPARDRCILGAIACGAIDPPVWCPVDLGPVRLQVSRDYLCVEGARIPMTPGVGQAAADSLDALLPTPAVVDAIEATAGALVTWLPQMPADGTEASTAAIVRCEEMTRAMLSVYQGSDSALLAGHRKDVVLASYMPPGRVVIYGARTLEGARIQPVFPIPGGHLPGHGDYYADRSHGIRAVKLDCLLKGEPTRLDDILAGPEAHLLGGPVARLRYPSPLRGEA